MEQTLSVDEGLELIGSGRVQALVILASGLGIMDLFLDTMGISITIPASSCELELDTLRKGILSCISYVGIALTSHLWGFLADSIGRNRSIRYSLIGSIFFSAIAAFVPNFWAIIALRLLSGMSLAGSSCITFVYLGEMMSNKVRTKLMILFGSSVGIAVIIPCGVGYVINATQPAIYFSEGYILSPWRIQWLVCLIPGIIGIFVYYSLPESPHFLASNGDTKAALEVLKEIYRRNNNSCEGFPINAISVKERDGHSEGYKGNLSGMFRSMIRETLILLRPPYLGPILSCCLIQYAIYTVTCGIGTWYPEITNRLTFDEDEGNSTAPGLSFCKIFAVKEVAIPSPADSPGVCRVQVNDKMFIDNAILGVGYLIANTVIYILQTKMVLRHIVILLLSLSCLCGFLLPSFTSEVAIQVCFTIFIMCSGSCVTTINIVTVGLFPTFLRGMTLSMTIVLGRVAIVIGVNILGFLLESNCEATIYGVAAIVAVAAFVLMFLLPKNAIESNSG